MSEYLHRRGSTSSDHVTKHKSRTPSSDTIAIKSIAAALYVATAIAPAFFVTSAMVIFSQPSTIAATNELLRTCSYVPA